MASVFQVPSRKVSSCFSFGTFGYESLSLLFHFSCLARTWSRIISSPSLINFRHPRLDSLWSQITKHIRSEASHLQSVRDPVSYCSVFAKPKYSQYTPTHKSEKSPSGRFLISLLCPREDLNLHALAGATTSR